MLLRLEISAGLLGHWARMQTFPFALSFGLKVEDFGNLKREIEGFGGK